MITREKLEEYQRRIMQHTEVKGFAVVVLTVKELSDLLDAVLRTSDTDVIK